MKLQTMLMGFVFAAILFACRTPAETAQIRENNIESDTLEYELVIFDPDFELWSAQNARPITFYDEEYLAGWNARLVVQWNTAISTARHDCRPNSYLNYDPSVDYGKEFNYRLFTYFRFMHERCGIFTGSPGDWGRRR
jgi:hypothetical protein